MQLSLHGNVGIQNRFISITRVTVVWVVPVSLRLLLSLVYFPLAVEYRGSYTCFSHLSLFFTVLRYRLETTKNNHTYTYIMVNWMRMMCQH